MAYGQRGQLGGQWSDLEPEPQISILHANQNEADPLNSHERGFVEESDGSTPIEGTRPVS